MLNKSKNMVIAEIARSKKERAKRMSQKKELKKGIIIEDNLTKKIQQKQENCKKRKGEKG